MDESTQPRKDSILEKHGFQGISRWPSKEEMSCSNASEEYFLPGFCPAQPVISKKDSITAFGSCFAGNVSRHLSTRGYSVNAHNWKHAKSDLIRIDEIMVHTPALLAQFEWAFNGTPLSDIIVDGKSHEVRSYHSQGEVRDIIASSDVFIVTYGLTEAWYDNVEDTYLWKFVPKKHLDSNRYVNKNIPYEENKRNIDSIYKLIRRNLPDAKIIFTLSPIPLLGTYSGKAIYSANEVSKSKLRVALDEFFGENKADDNLFYFPSYELVKYYIDDAWEEDNRHIKPETIAKIMTIFEDKFCHDNPQVAE